MVNTKGEVIGKHNGIYGYTVGQRKGLGLTSKEPLYVIKVDKNNNQVIIGKEEELYADNAKANNINYTYLNNMPEKMEIEAKIRYSSKPAKAVLKTLPNQEASIDFYEKQRAITPGQAIVFYDKDIVLRRRNNNIIPDTKEEGG